MIPGVHIYIDGVIKEGDKVVRKVRRQKGHSFVKQFTQQLLRMFTFPISTSIKDTSNSAVNYSVDTIYSYILVNSSLGITSYGLVVGSNATGVDISDYKLNTLIAHGVNAGQLQYSSTIVGAIKVLSL